MINKKLKLLSKTTIVYLIVTCIVFFVTSIFLFKAIDNYLEDEVEQRFQFFEHRAKSALHRGHKSKINKKYLDVTKLDKEPDLNKYPIYSDTTMYDSHLDRNSLFRKKTVVVSYKKDFYEIVMATGLDEFVLLKKAIARILLPAVIFLALIVVIANFVLSGFFLKPFHKILELMKIYKVGSKENLSVVKTNTVEFEKMQALFLGMVDRIEDDYKNLKEYTENMAHEMQTPLAVMRNKILDLMSDENLDENKSKVIKSVYDEVNHLSNLGKTLNLLTKIENNEYKNTKTIGTKDLLEDILNNYSELAELKNLKLEYHLDDQNKMDIDPKLFRIMIDNLMRNAVRYSSEEGTINVVSDSQSIRISNSGEKLTFEPEKLFERFMSSNNDSNSIGLGLSIVKKICDMNCVKIKYEYQDGTHIFILSGNC